MMGEFKPKLKQAVSKVETVAGAIRSPNGRTDDDPREGEKRHTISPAEQLRQFKRIAEQLIARR